MVGAQASKSNIRIVQDCLLGSYLMTKTDEAIEKSEFQTMCMALDPFDMDEYAQKLQDIKEVYEKFGKEIPLYSGKSLFSMLLPRDFIYETKKNGVKVYRGVLYEGSITKLNLGSGHQSIIRVIHKEYEEQVSLGFVNNVQFLANAFIMYHGFSVGMSDCMIKEKQDIQTVITKAMIEADGYAENTFDPVIRESKVTLALGKARDIGMRIAKSSLGDTNRFVDTVTAGSKGDYFNIAQIMGLLGQQNIVGGRVTPQMSKNTRTLPHYPLDGMDTAMEYESKGFVRNSFIHGLNPKEFWFHAATGREGINLWFLTADYLISCLLILIRANSVIVGFDIIC